ncbi:MAG: D-alanyl-D-alanine carboxypeptidase [Oscillospiraceae bacterium]|nr:D-alanyl-D-alanine carboxypeptidase [Oscillospiraceae bacterium]
MYILKKIAAVVLAACTVCGIIFCSATTCYAGGEKSDNSSLTDKQTAADISYEEVSAPDKHNVPEDVRTAVKAASAILIEQTTGRVLFEFNPDEPRAPASITKVMTLLLVMEAIDNGELSLSDSITASEHACSMGGSQIWLEPGETMSVDELIRATAIASANDAAVALAEHLGGSEQGFVELMNARAANLGMSNTRFKNASGLDEDGHFTTARDISTMSAELLKHELIKEYSTVWMDSLRNGETELVNTNKLIRFYKGATGLKTGTTDEAGRCVTASAMRGDMQVIAVVLGAENRDEQFSSASALLNYAFDSYTMYTPPSAEEQLIPIKVEGGTSDEVFPVCSAPQKLLLQKGAEKQLEQIVELPETLSAPIEAGQQIGRVMLKINGETIGEYAVTAGNTVEKMTFGRAFAILFACLMQS